MDRLNNFAGGVDVTGPTRADMGAATEAVVAVLEAALGAGPRMDQGVPGGEWTIGSTASHIAIAQEVFAGLLDGGGNPFAGAHDAARFAEVNARLLAEAGQRDALELAAAAARATDTFLERAAVAPADARYDSPLGSMDISTLMSYCLCHLLQHTHAITAAMDRPSPIADAHLRLAMPFVRHAVPFAYGMKTGPGMTAAVEFRLRGQRSFAIRFTPEEARVDDGARGPVDAHVGMAPQAFMLVLLGHRSALSLALRGKALAWGRRPWLALQVKDYLPGV